MKPWNLISPPPIAPAENLNGWLNKFERAQQKSFRFSGCWIYYLCFFSALSRNSSVAEHHVQHDGGRKGGTQHGWLVPDVIQFCSSQHTPFVSSDLCQLRSWCRSEEIHRRPWQGRVSKTFSFSPLPSMSWCHRTPGKTQYKLPSCGCIRGEEDRIGPLVQLLS